MKLLDDAAMRQFIRDGYVTVQADLPGGLSESVVEQLDTVLAAEGNPGNNLLPRVPVLRKVFEDPVVHGALTSILGSEYHMHPHRHPHSNSPGRRGASLHQDSMARRLHHRCRWVAVFYYPQDTPMEMGPTAVIPGSQYYWFRNDDSHVPFARREGPPPKPVPSNAPPPPDRMIIFPRFCRSNNVSTARQHR